VFTVILMYCVLPFHSIVPSTNLHIVLTNLSKNTHTHKKFFFKMQAYLHLTATQRITVNRILSFDQTAVICLRRKDSNRLISTVEENTGINGVNVGNATDADNAMPSSYQYISATLPAHKTHKTSYLPVSSSIQESRHRAQ
jgi:hypothetical protein